MTFMQFLVTLALALDGLWAGIQAAHPIPDKAAVREWQAAVEAGYTEIGLDNNNPGPPLFVFMPGNGWMGATEGMWRKGCLRTYALNTALLNKTSPFYATPEWRAVVAHEVAHVYQGVKCANNPAQVESTAEIAGLAVLAHMAEGGDPDAAAALVYDLRRSAILAALDGGAWGILDQLQLSDQERAYFEGLSPYELHARGELYWTRTLDGLYIETTTGDGNYTPAEGYLYWGDVDAAALHSFVEGLLHEQ